MATNIYPGSLQALGLAPETTYGTPVAAPTIFVPCESVPKWDPKINIIKDQGLRGTMGVEFNAIQGMRYDEVTYTALLFGDSVFPHLVNMMGAVDQVTGTGVAPTGTLSAAAAAGATSVSSSVSIATGTLIQIDTGANAEIVTTTGAPTGVGPYTIPVPALGKAHASGVAITGTAQPFTHKESLNNGAVAGTAQPKSYTGFVYLPNGRCKQIPGMMLSDLKFSLKVNDKASMSATWAGLPALEIAAPVYTPTTLLPMNSTNLTVQFAGAGAPQYASLQIDIKRDTKPVPGMTGSNSPVAIFAGSQTVTGTLDGIFQGTTDVALVDYLANVQPTLSASIYADNDPTHPLTLQMSKIALMSAPPVGSMTSYMSIQSAFDALMNATDALDGKLSPIQATLASTASTAY